MITRETVWYIAPYDEVVITHKDAGVLYAIPEYYFYDFKDGRGPRLIQNRLKLIRTEIRMKNWNKAIKKKFIIKLGLL